jgi:hypothetical protein
LLKLIEFDYRSLKTWIAVGGWRFNVKGSESLVASVLVD